MLINNTLNPHGNCFTVPNEIYNLGLSMGAIAVYGFLLRLEDRHPGKDQYTCHPSYKTIGSAVGRSARSVAKYVQELVEAALIRTEPTSVITRDGQKRNGNLRYTILPIRGAVELYHERQLAQLGAGVQKKRKLMDAAEKKRKRRSAEIIANSVYFGDSRPKQENEDEPPAYGSYELTDSFASEGGGFGDFGVPDGFDPGFGA